MMHSNRGGKFRGGHHRGGQNQGGFKGNRYSDEHDNRSNTNFKSNRRVSFKTSGRLNKSIDDMKIKAYLENDETMGAEIASSSSMESGKGRRPFRKGSPIPRGVTGGYKLIQHPTGWYMVTIFKGGKYEKDTLLRLIMSALSPTTFNAQFYNIDMSQNVTFYVDDFDIAEKMLRQDKKIQLPDGFQMGIRVRGSVPQVRIDATLKEKMKLAMVKRYNAQTKAMDLTKFHGDADFTDVFCALSRPQIMIAAIDIIAENIPDLEALNLNDNRLGMLDHLRILSTKLPKLKILYLGSNKIFTLASLDVFKNLPIVELYLDGNPCKKRFKDNASYVSEIKKRFPKLLKLDGADLGPSIGFDVAEDDHKLPQWKQAFFSNENGQELVATFLKQYFAIYDSDNRQQLLEAYHDNAMFSITATGNQHYTREEILSSYWKIGRNLKHPKANDYKMISLKRGKLSIVALLNDLPPSRHDLNSFAVDLTFFTPQMICLTVTGLFKEKNVANSKAEHARIFQKTLVIVPNNGGFCIKNEMLHINNASPAQSRNSFKSPAPQITAPSTSIQASPSVSVAPGAPDDSTKMKMIQAMSLQSNMNIEWSKKCLEETNWDFERAGFVFGELFKQSKIPPEAFAK